MELSKAGFDEDERLEQPCYGCLKVLIKLMHRRISPSFMPLQRYKGLSKPLDVAHLGRAYHARRLFFEPCPPALLTRCVFARVCKVRIDACLRRANGARLPGFAIRVLAPARCFVVFSTTEADGVIRDPY